MDKRILITFLLFFGFGILGFGQEPKESAPVKSSSSSSSPSSSRTKQQAKADKSVNKGAEKKAKMKKKDAEWQARGEQKKIQHWGKTKNKVDKQRDRIKKRMRIHNFFW